MRSGLKNIYDRAGIHFRVCREGGVAELNERRAAQLDSVEALRTE